MKLGIHEETCGAFGPHPVGTKALEPDIVLSAIRTAVEEYNWEGCENGKGFISLPESMIPLVRSGCGKHTGKVADYHVRIWRGNPEVFLRPEFAGPCTGVAALVYTRAAFEADPQTTEKDLEAVADSTHILVALIAFCGPQPKPGAWRFLVNLSGGNNDYIAATKEKLVAWAVAAVEYNQTWATVAELEPPSDEDIARGYPGRMYLGSR